VTSTPPPPGGDGVAIAILGAGAGRRLGAAVPKPLVELAGRPLVAWALDAARGSGLAPVLLVVGAGGDAVAAAAEAATRPGPVEIVRSQDWELGIAHSLRAALDALGARAGIGAVCVGLADQPLVGADAYRRLAAAYDAGAELAVATYSGRRGNPVLVSRTVWAEAQQLEGDEGARVLMRRHGATEVACDGTGDPADVDTIEDLAAMEARCASRTAFE